MAYEDWPATVVAAVRARLPFRRDVEILDMLAEGCSRRAIKTALACGQHRIDRVRRTIRRWDEWYKRNGNQFAGGAGT